MAQAQASAAKLDRLFPEDTMQQKLYLPLVLSIIERNRGNAASSGLAGSTRFDVDSHDLLRVQYGTLVRNASRARAIAASPTVILRSLLVTVPA